MYVKFNCTDGTIVFVQPRGIDAVIAQNAPNQSLLVLRSGLTYHVEGKAEEIAEVLRGAAYGIAAHMPRGF